MAMNCSVMANVFEAIEQESSRLVITTLLADLLAQATPEEASIICTLSLGQLNPPYIGTHFNIAQKNIAPVIADMLGIANADAEKEIKSAGDAGTVIATGSWDNNNTLTVTALYDALSAIENMSGTGSTEHKSKELIALLRCLDPITAKYVVRIVIGKLRMGFSDMTIVDALSWMQAGNKSLRPVIENAYNVRVDIGLIAKILKQDGIEALQNMTVTVGIPIRPAAAERLPTPKAIVEKFGFCVAQPKLDGFRLQIHIDNAGSHPKINFFSRHLNDMSEMFPDIIPSLTQLPVQTIVCEGEAIGYDLNTGAFLPFQETVKRRRKHGIEQAAAEFPLKIYLFDLLYIDGVSVLGKTHKERRAHLQKVIPDTNKLVHVIDEKPIETAEQLKDYFVATVAAGLEGLVVKKPDAVYKPGKRDFGWIKLKRKQEGTLEDTVDCVVLGYYAGRGKRAQFGIGAFLVGVYNKEKDLFESVAKVGTGLSDDEFKEMKKMCDERAVSSKPSNVVCAKDLTPDVWVTPDIVCVVLADELTLSPIHAAGKTDTHLGYALRFPRFMGYRDDKGPQEATTSTEIKQLYENQFKK